MMARGQCICMILNFKRKTFSRRLSCISGAITVALTVSRATEMLTLVRREYHGKQGINCQLPSNFNIVTNREEHFRSFIKLTNSYDMHNKLIRFVNS